MNLAEFLEDTFYKLTQFKLVQIALFEAGIADKNNGENRFLLR